MKGYVVIDLEMCPVTKSNRTTEYHYADETIQIGAVLLDEKYDLISKFSTYVSPEYGTLTRYIQNLTGITAEHLINAPKMEEALERLTKWIPEGDITMVSWSHTDDLQIKHELKGKNISNPRMEELLEHWEDAQESFKQKTSSTRAFNLAEALNAADIDFEGSEHDGLDDAYNTSKLYRKLCREETLHLNPIFESVRNDKVEHLSYNPFAALLTILPA